MAITINTNVTSLVAQRNLNNAQGRLSESMEKLSSGLRIRRAKDDAAGLAISTLMAKKVAGLHQGVRNANDGISLVQTNEAALVEVGNNLQRMHELAIQSANGVYVAGDRSAMQVEFSALRTEIDRVANTAEFNGFKLLDGTSSTFAIQVGDGNTANDQINVSLTDANVSALGISAATITSAAGASAAIGTLNTAIANVSKKRADFGAFESRLETAVQSNIQQAENLEAAKSRIVDVDFASETAKLARENILTQASTSMLAQANSLPQLALSLLG